MTRIIYIVRQKGAKSIVLNPPTLCTYSSPLPSGSCVIKSLEIHSAERILQTFHHATQIYILLIYVFVYSLLFFVFYTKAEAEEEIQLGK